MINRTSTRHRPASVGLPPQPTISAPAAATALALIDRAAKRRVASQTKPSKKGKR